MYQLCKLVVGFEAAQKAAELVVVGVQGQALLRAQDLPRPLHQMVQEPAALRVTDEERPSDRCEPHLSQRTASSVPSCAITDDSHCLKRGRLEHSDTQTVGCICG